MRLLIVEDDRELREALTDLLRQSGYSVDAYDNGRQAYEILLLHSYELAIVDLSLPHMDGIELIRNLRRRANRIPILVVTARDALDDRVSGLDAGADDYLVKPFELPELEARVRALLRRQNTLAGSQLKVGPLTLTLGDPRVQLGESFVDLPAGEFLLLEILAARAGKVVSKERIAEQLTRGREPPSDTAIEVSMHRLRRRLGAHGLHVRTLRGFGYLLEFNVVKE